jgi:hypothetical protein
MIVGHVNSQREAIIQLAVLGEGHQRQGIKAIIDTGYTGFGGSSRIASSEGKMIQAQITTRSTGQAIQGKINPSSLSCCFKASGS